MYNIQKKPIRYKQSCLADFLEKSLKKVLESTSKSNAFIRCEFVGLVGRRKVKDQIIMTHNP